MATAVQMHVLQLQRLQLSLLGGHLRLQLSHLATNDTQQQVGQGTQKHTPKEDVKQFCD
jgi:hypothetical protein